MKHRFVSTARLSLLPVIAIAALPATHCARAAISNGTDEATPEEYLAAVAASTTPLASPAAPRSAGKREMVDCINPMIERELRWGFAAAGAPKGGSRIARQRAR